MMFREPVMVYTTEIHQYEDGNDAEYDFKCTECGKVNHRPFVCVNAKLHCDNCNKKFYCDEVERVSENRFNQILSAK